MEKRPARGVAMTLAALVAGAVLTAPSGAAKRIDEVSCAAATTSTISWASGTTRITYYWVNSSGAQTGNGEIDPRGPGTVTVRTPTASATLIATYYKRRDPSFEMRAPCE